MKNDPIFKVHPHLEKVYVTSDGQKFYQENDAKNHGKTLKDKTVEPVYNQSKLEKAEDVNIEDTGASKEVIKDTPKEDWKVVLGKIEKAETLEELDQFKADTRPSVVKALAAKKEELSKPAQGEGTEGTGTDSGTEDNQNKE